MTIRNIKICIIAGEPSGDIIGAKLVRGLKKQVEKIELIGVGGTELAKEGLKTFFSMSEISIMGFAEVILKLVRIGRLISETARYIIEQKPDVIITIDSYGFNTRVVRKIKNALPMTKCIHYVAPTVWAMKPNRVHAIKELYDLQLALLPFEKQYFEDAGMACEYVGHPIIEDYISPKLPKNVIFEKHHIDSNSKILIMMPGSRMQELHKHTTLFSDACAKLKKNHPNVKLVIPTFPEFEHFLREKTHHLDPLILTTASAKAELMPFASAAIVKSGTSALETAHYNIPTVVAYKMNPLSYWYVKSQIKVKYISLINILNDEEIFKERIQSDCTPHNIALDLEAILSSNQIHTIKKCQDTFAMLGAGEHLTPSDKAANAILKLLNS
jgi:lipid-A-disaccharide synthase